ncbi:MAG: hypothetical protein RBT11_19670 [Desulfobacterales bacterium]|nr:hypothetical protein [Desulfobacterales bacterium]
MANANLDFVTKETRDTIDQVLGSDGIHDEVKSILRRNLERDCVDAYCDVSLAARLLKMVQDDCLGRPPRALLAN